MAIASQLVELFRQQGVTISTGLNPFHFGGLKEVPYTWFTKDGYTISTGFGIALQEVYFLEHILSAKPPRNALVVGNAMGWSTIALSLSAPEARVIGIDTGTDEQSRRGIELTNQIAEAGNLNLAAVVGTSPDDVESVCSREFATPIDFAFIDGLHTNEQVVKDFVAVRSCTTTDCVFLFHDVTEACLGPGLDEIRKIAPELRKTSLGATTSGMALLYSNEFADIINAAAAAFVVAPGAQGVIDRAIRHHRHRYLNRLFRSCVKRYNSIARAIGLGTLPLPANTVERTMKS